LKWDGIRERELRGAGIPGQDAAIGDKGDQLSLDQSLSEACLTLHAPNVVDDAIHIIESATGLRDIFRKESPGLAAEDSSPFGG